MMIKTLMDNKRIMELQVVYFCVG